MANMTSKLDSRSISHLHTDSEVRTHPNNFFPTDIYTINVWLPSLTKFIIDVLTGTLDKSYLGFEAFWIKVDPRKGVARVLEREQAPLQTESEGSQLLE